MPKDVSNVGDVADMAPEVGAFPVDLAADATAKDTRNQSDGAASADVEDVADGGAELRDMPVEDMRAPPGCPGYTSMMPIAYWSLDEADPLGNYPPDYAAPQVSDLRLVGEPLQTAGVHEGGVSFDGVDDALIFDHAPAFETAEGTVAVWFRMPEIAAETQSVPFSKDALGFGEGGHLRVAIESGLVVLRLQAQDMSHSATSTAELLPDTWYHVVATFGSAGLRLYVDGALEASGLYTGGLFEAGSVMNTEPGAVGASNHRSEAGLPTPLGDHFRGQIDEVAFFDYQLTPDQVQDLRQFCTP